uniref:AIG1-type G domain-containing protein n=1 Tax=Macrostomum lignano TaxID=282301 RepID=A0A1I8GAU7_9PLAT
MPEKIFLKMTTALLLVSKTGNGKSSLANALLNTTRFQVGRGMLSSTASCMCISTRARGRDLTVVDTPGTMDVADEEKAKTEIRRAMEFCPNGFDGFLVVVKCDARFTAEERRAIEVVAEMFGDQFYKHAIVVFSHGDEFDNDETEFRNELQEIRKKIPYLDQLLTKCGNRFALVDNGRRCDTAVQDRQIEALLSKADSLVASNGGKKYTSVEQRNAEEAERKKAEEAEAKRRQEKLEFERRIREQVTAEVKQEQQQSVDWLGTTVKVIDIVSKVTSIPGKSNCPCCKVPWLSKACTATSSATHWGSS